VEELNELMQHRREKLKKIIDKKINPYPYKFERTHLSKQILDDFENLEGKETEIAGRIISLRSHGKSTFFHILDGEGKIQVYVKEDEVGKENYEFLALLDLGDFVGIEGKPFKTKTGEITVKAKNLVLLSKSLRPLPEKWHGLQDKELRYRQRYVDLFVNPQVKEVFIKRTMIIAALRRYLDGLGFIEVETPILQPIYGGALARPFKTHHHSLDMDLYLRIADELYLKRLIVGGFEKVYEFCKDFRNEGMDKSHNPEFSMLELYQAYIDYNDVMDLCQDMISQIAQDVLGTKKITYQGNEIDLTPPWKRVSYLDSFKEYAGIDIQGKDENQIRQIVKELNLDTNLEQNREKLLDSIFGSQVQTRLLSPTFVIDYPIEISPLAKHHREKKGLTERFEIFIGTCEIGNAFSELNDPLDQRQRFEQQTKLAKAGDEEAFVLDEGFIRALEYGMPPTGGLGVGIDRLVMILTDSPSIRDVILFPQMRPEK
jgi:lysyl-tRNA synthetase, class II